MIVTLMAVFWFATWHASVVIGFVDGGEEQSCQTYVGER
jgi:hypothetical protein